MTTYSPPGFRVGRSGATGLVARSRAQVIADERHQRADRPFDPWQWAAHKEALLALSRQNRSVTEAKTS